MTDFRALCAELVGWAERTSAHYVVHPDVILRARAALAEPQAPIPVADQLRLMAAGIRYGYQAGHEATVESCYGDPDEVAEEMAPEILSEISAAAIPLPEVTDEA
jgi:hypothetical protein